MGWGKRKGKGNAEKGITQKNKKRMVSRSKSRKTIGPCSSSAQASTFRRFPMSPLEQKEGRSLWVMKGWVSGLCACTCVYVWVSWMCVCVCGVWEVKVSGWGTGYEQVAVMAWWKCVLGEAWQHGHRASLIPLTVVSYNLLWIKSSLIWWHI